HDVVAAQSVFTIAGFDRHQLARHDQPASHRLPAYRLAGAPWTVRLGDRFPLALFIAKEAGSPFGRGDAFDSPKEAVGDLAQNLVGEIVAIDFWIAEPRNALE